MEATQKTILTQSFFNKDAIKLAKALLGKVLYSNYQGLWLCAQVIETEAYYTHEKASHASLGFTEKRKALFMEPGTIYMYYSRGGDSLNISAKGEGNAVLIKSAIPYQGAKDYKKMIRLMQKLNPLPNNRIREPMRLCSGQVLMCRALNLKVKRWDGQQFDHEHFFIKDVNYYPSHIIETTRLGIRKERDAHLPYRFIDQCYLKFCTRSALL